LNVSSFCQWNSAIVYLNAFFHSLPVALPSVEFALFVRISCLMAAPDADASQI
jgi:hypothetical protein